MRTIKEVSRLAGVSIRTLHYYDSIGLLSPEKETESGYRLYDDTDLERLQQILLFRELQFPLKEIKGILDSPGFDKKKALEQQIKLLELKKEHLENLIDFARGIIMIGVRPLEFSVFDTKKIDEYAKAAKESYGKTKEYQEFVEKSKNRSKEEEAAISAKMMGIFIGFGKLMDKKPSDSAVQKQVKYLHKFINENFYACSKEILSNLGKMYAGGGSMTENIDKAGGEGTAEFTSQAIEAYVSSGL